MKQKLLEQTDGSITELRKLKQQLKPLVYGGRGRGGRGGEQSHWLELSVINQLLKEHDAEAVPPPPSNPTSNNRHSYNLRFTPPVTAMCPSLPVHPSLPVRPSLPVHPSFPVRPLATHISNVRPSLSVHPLANVQPLSNPLSPTVHPLPYPMYPLPPTVRPLSGGVPHSAVPYYPPPTPPTPPVSSHDVSTIAHQYRPNPHNI